MPSEGPTPVDDDEGDPTVRHLRAALDSAEDETVRYHIRQALQHELLDEEGATS